MAHVSRKLSGSLQGALAGGGDPATSPLYVFGPFLQLLIVGGAVGVSFGASIWLAVLTVVTASAMYRLVMRWVTDGSGGSGLSEEEFGAWAVKLNASITVVEYTLTFLVSMAALVTFIADRVPALNARVLGFEVRVFLAILLSVMVGVLVNRGPKTAARTFGPATGAVLLLLWAMILTTIWRYGLRLPDFQLAAFSAKYVGFTLGGYSRILALMTGVEIFANLVAAYEGSPEQRAKKAFRSLLIIMGTTVLTMLIVGPAIRDTANALDSNVSVFTQTMDKLLPGPLSYLGTLVGVAVLLSAAAASAQGLQNLALGLRYRHYIPASVGQQNRFGVADKPVWFEIGICAICFLIFGTSEDTYLSLYAAGVFILLSLTGWAAVKRLVRELRPAWSVRGTLGLLGTIVGVLLTSGATVVIFAERFRQGAWAYALMLPLLYAGFSWFRGRLGAPAKAKDRLGRIVSASFGEPGADRALEMPAATWSSTRAFEHLLVPLDLSSDAERALPIAQALARRFQSNITLLTVLENEADNEASNSTEVAGYLENVAGELRASAKSVKPEVLRGDPSARIGELSNGGVGAVVMTLRERPRFQRWLFSGVLNRVLYQTTPPVIVVRPGQSWRSTRSLFQRLLVALDGSAISEEILPFVVELASAFGGRVTLLTVFEAVESEELVSELRAYLARIAERLQRAGIQASVLTRAGGAVQTILAVAEEERFDLIMFVSHGSGGLERQEHVKVGSVANGVLQATPCPVFIVSATVPV